MKNVTAICAKFFFCFINVSVEKETLKTCFTCLDSFSICILRQNNGYLRLDEFLYGRCVNIFIPGEIAYMH